MVVSFLMSKNGTLPREVRKTKTVQRTDSVSLDKATFTSEGFLMDRPVIARTGILEYRNPDGSIRREFRPPEEVFKTDSLQSFKGKPIVMGHSAGMITADNAKRTMIGTMLSEGIQDGENVRADVMIHDTKALNSGMRALSVGYKVDEDWTPGEYNGVKYDLVQRNIMVNHLGLVPRGRAGEIARLTLDGDQIEEYEEEKKETKTMPTIKLDSGLTYEAIPEVVVAFDKLKADNADLSQKLKIERGNVQTVTTESKTKLDQLEAERDTLKAQIATHATELAKIKQDAIDGINDAVKARVELLKIAETHKVEKADSLTDKEIKIAVIKKSRNDSALDLTAKSDEYINAAFDFTKDTTSSRNDALEQQRKIMNQKIKQDGNTEQGTSADARQRMIEKMKNAHQGGK